MGSSGRLPRPHLLTWRIPEMSSRMLTGSDPSTGVLRAQHFPALTFVRPPLHPELAACLMWQDPRHFREAGGRVLSIFILFSATVLTPAITFALSHPAVGHHSQPLLNAVWPRWASSVLEGGFGGTERAGSKFENHRR